ncbi:MAG: DUF2017 family protein [Agrococcus casei]|uniref:DUF2017 domain-containing protein n=1 Tax=Agrococcus casei LMG 22410 TaxID=1255656 RepID=A0A1R4GJR4_9MICO|nr:DUF2017 family protein [Agrococcus casei]SJM68477.1 DUF2017 domain-containing protein [Agrococcus casei LMG 22410]
MHAWQKVHDGVEAVFDLDEAKMLENLAEQLKRLHRAAGQGALNFEDPAVLRLYPDAYDDAEEAHEFRRLALPELAAARERYHDAVIVGSVTAKREGDTATVHVGSEEIDDWLRALSDMRLVLTTRVEQGNEAFQGVTDWLGYVQATLLEVL